MAERDVVDVEQDFLFALPVPDLVTGVAGVGQDRADGAFGPGDAAAVPVAVPVVCGRAGDAVAGQPLGDGVEARAGNELGEDAGDDGRGLLVKAETV